MSVADRQNLAAFAHGRQLKGICVYCRIPKTLDADKLRHPGMLLAGAQKPSGHLDSGLKPAGMTIEGSEVSFSFKLRPRTWRHRWIPARNMSESD
jgi:hypothetical protein